MGSDTALIKFSVAHTLELREEPRLEVVAGGRLEAGQLRHRLDFAEHPRSAFGPRDRTGIVRRLNNEESTGQWIVVDGAVQNDDLDDLARRLATSGARGILTPQRAATDGYLSKRVLGGGAVALPMIAVRPDLLAQLVGSTIRASVPLRRIRARGANVVAALPGFDPELRNRPVVITAHYDGVGDDPQRRFPGAADNASGVAVMLEIGRVLAGLERRAPRPILLVALDGEEMGAQGSRLHASVLTQSGQQAEVINLDMVARFNDVVAVEVGPGANRIAAALDRAGKFLRLPLATAQVASDNRRYASAGIPAVGLAMGAASYHSPVDRPDRVENAAMAAAGRLVLATIWQLAHAPGRDA